MVVLVCDGSQQRSVAQTSAFGIVGQQEEVVPQAQQGCQGRTRFSARGFIRGDSLCAVRIWVLYAVAQSRTAVVFHMVVWEASVEGSQDFQLV